MSTPTVDYDALAKQYGATSSAVDYDALAKQHGAISSEATVKAAPKPGSWAWFKEKGYEAADAVTNALPAGGATIGALLGGGAAGVPTGGTASPLGAIGGAGLGGMAGEATKKVLRQALGFDEHEAVGKTANDISKAGLIQGAIQGGSELLAPLAGPLQNAAETQYVRALSPTTKANKAIAQKIAPEMIDRGLHGSLTNLADQAGTEAQAVQPALNQAYANAPTSMGKGAGPQIVSDLEALKGKYIVNGQIAKPEAVNAISGVQDIVRQQGADISPSDLRDLKRVFDIDPAAKNAYAGADIATQYTLKAEKAAANSIRNIVHSASPDIAALDKEISFWLNVQRVTSQSALRQAGQEGGLLKTFLPLAAAGTGIGTGYVAGAHAGLEAAGATVLTGLAARVLRSSAWRTASAVAKDGFADALARGDVGQVASLATRFGVAQASPTRLQPQSDLPTQQQ